MAQSSPSMTSELPRVDPPHPAGTTSPSARGDTYWLDPDPPTTIARSDGGGQHPPHGSVVSGGPDDVVARPDDVVARRTRARHRVDHSSPTHVALEGPYPPVTGPGPSIATPPGTSSPPLRGHAVSPAPGSECAAAVMEMLRQQQEMFRQQQELDRKRQEQQHEHDRELDRKRQEHDRELDREREDKRETTRARERAEDLERQEQQQEMLRRQHEHDREQRDHDRQLDRERAAERDRLLSEQLRRDMANSPRFSRRGTPTGTPVPAVDRPKPAPRKTPH